MRPSSPNNFARRPRKQPPSSLGSVPRQHGRCKHEAQLLQCTRATPEAQHQAQLHSVPRQHGRCKREAQLIQCTCATPEAQHQAQLQVWTGSPPKQLSLGTQRQPNLDSRAGSISYWPHKAAFQVTSITHTYLEGAEPCYS